MRAASLFGPAARVRLCAARHGGQECTTAAEGAAVVAWVESPTLWPLALVNVGIGRVSIVDSIEVRRSAERSMIRCRRLRVSVSKSLSIASSGDRRADRPAPAGQCTMAACRLRAGWRHSRPLAQAGLAGVAWCARAPGRPGAGAQASPRECVPDAARGYLIDLIISRSAPHTRQCVPLTGGHPAFTASRRSLHGYKGPHSSRHRVFPPSLHHHRQRADQRPAR